MAPFQAGVGDRRSSFITCGLILLSLLIAVTFCEAYNSENDNSLKSTTPPSKILKTIIVPDYYPYTFVNDKGIPDGFSVDLAQAVVQSMDMKLEISAGTWEHAREALENGTIDFLPMMAASHLRRQSFDFSVPHSIAYDAIFVRKGDQKIDSLNDLSGKTIIVMNRDAAHDVLLATPASDTITLILVDSLPNGLRLLASGKGDAAIMPKLVGLLLAKKFGIANVDESPVTIESYSRPFSFAVKKGNTALLERLGQGLSAVDASGQYGEIYEKWFGVLASPGLTWKSLRYLVGIAAASALVGIVLLAWSLSLRKLVSQRTRALESEILVRKETEAALRQSEDRYRGVFENAAVGIDIVDSNGRLLRVNSCLSEMLGYTQEEMTNLTFCDVSHPDDVEVSLIRHEKMVRGETESYRFEKRYIKKDRDVLWADVSVSPVRRPDGVHLATIGVIADISDRKRTEEALRQSEEKYRTLFEESFDGLFITSPGGKILDMNKKGVAMLGYDTKEEILNLDLERDVYAHPPDRKWILEMVNARGSAEYQVVVKKKNGEEMITHCALAAVKDEQGVITAYRGIIRDITDRKISEELTQRRLNLLEFAASHPLDELLQKTLDEIGILTNSPIGFYHFVEGDQTTLSLQAWSTRTINEFCKTEGKGRHYSIDRAGVWVDCLYERKPVIHNDYATLPHRKGMPEGHAAVIRELVVPIMKSDSIVAVLGMGNKPTDYTEKDVEIVSYLADVAWEITERKRMEESLKERDIQYRTLFEESIDGVYSVLKDGTITDSNPAFCELFGYMREEMIGKDISELYLDSADRPKFQKEIEKNGFVKDYEVKFQKRDGTELDCLISSSLILQEGGSIAGYRGIVRDLTARKELHRQLQQAQKMEAVGTLAGGIAHDFNNILQVVLGYSELVLDDEELPDRLRNDLGRVILAGRNGSDLVQRLLTFSRKSETRPLNLDLNQRIRLTQKFLERTIPKMVDIRVILADDLARIYVDPTQVDQVLMNLAVNARDAMPEGGKLVIETANVFLDERSDKALLGAKPGEYVLLSVSDTGLGMNKETLGHIFEPFYTTKEAGKGTGLGLAMVYGIVRQHGGYITCYSELGEGTTFKMYFPALRVSAYPS